jgi:RNA polymerase sigma-70 factor (ECF subfamily)
MSARDRQREFEGLLEPLLPAAFGLALQLARHRDDAEDLVQEAAVRAFRAFDSFTPGTNFKAWFFKILTNGYFQRYRKRQREPELVPIEDVPDLYLYSATAAAGLHAQSADPAALVLGRLDEEQVTRAVAGLPEEFRVVSALYFMEQLSYQEIAEIVDCPVGTVRSRLHRGRKLLQKALWQLAQEQGLIAELGGEAG